MRYIEVTYRPQLEVLIFTDKHSFDKALDRSLGFSQIYRFVLTTLDGVRDISSIVIHRSSKQQRQFKPPLLLNLLIQQIKTCSVYWSAK